MAIDPATMLSSIEVAISIVDVIKSLHESDLRKKIFSKQTFLNYDIKWLIDQYKEEIPIAALMPYSEVVSWLEPTKEQTLKKVSQINVYITNKKFQLCAEPSMLKEFQVESLHKIKEAKKMTSDERIIRLDKVEIDKDETRLYIKPAFYSDQAQSSLVLDWEGSHALKRSGINSLRSFLTARYEHNLPPLNDKYLANTVGVSAILLYKEAGQLIPYMPHRVGNKLKDYVKKTGRTGKSVAVFEGGSHCTASGATQWGPGNTFDTSITDDMYKELYEEVGVEKHHIDLMLPVALCREFLRAGKPQIFFVGITNRTRDQLDRLRAEAIKRTLKLELVPEIHDGALSYRTKEQLYTRLKSYGVTIEAAANLYYAEKFIKTFAS